MKYELNEERRDGDLEIIRSGNFIIRVERQISQRCQERKKEKKRETKWGMKECERCFFQIATSHVQVAIRLASRNFLKSLL